MNELQVESWSNFSMDTNVPDVRPTSLEIHKHWSVTPPTPHTPTIPPLATNR